MSLHKGTLLSTQHVVNCRQLMILYIEYNTAYGLHYKNLTILSSVYEFITVTFMTIIFAYCRFTKYATNSDIIINDYY